MVFVDKPAILALANACHIRNVAWVMSNTTKSCVLHCCVYCIFLFNIRLQDDNNIQLGPYYGF